MTIFHLNEKLGALIHYLRYIIALRSSVTIQDPMLFSTYE